MSLKHIMLILRKDLRVESRSKLTLNFTLLFSTLTLLIFSFSFQFAFENKAMLLGGLLWFIFLFTSILGVSQSFLVEKERGTLEGLQLAPIEPYTILIGKTLYFLFLTLLIEIVVFGLSIIFFNLPIGPYLLNVLVILTLGNCGLVAVNSSLSVLLINAKARELLLPIVTFPILFPLISTAISATRTVLEGAPLSDVRNEIMLLSAFIVAMFTAALATFRYSLESV